MRGVRTRQTRRGRGLPGYLMMEVMLGGGMAALLVAILYVNIGQARMRMIEGARTATAASIIDATFEILNGYGYDEIDAQAAALGPAPSGAKVNDLDGKYVRIVEVTTTGIRKEVTVTVTFSGVGGTIKNISQSTAFWDVGS